LVVLQEADQKISIDEEILNVIIGREDKCHWDMEQ
jgi:hypothetical protein